MKTVKLSDFIPFPGNYFSYLFQNDLILKNNEFVLLRTIGIEDIAMEAKVIQQVKIADSVKVQFHVVRPLKLITNSTPTPLAVSCQNKTIEPNEKNEFKELLRKWDASEYSLEPNHYFEHFDKTDSRERFLELVGGAINRPNKFPFNIKDTLETSLRARVGVFSFDTCERQLEEIKKIIISESSVI